MTHPTIPLRRVQPMAFDCGECDLRGECHARQGRGCARSDEATRAVYRALARPFLALWRALWRLA